MKSLLPVFRLMELAWISFQTWRMHPLSPYINRAVIRRNELENAK